MWNDIEIFANDDTGTGRLPVGLGQECGTALYQVDTLLRITSQEKVSVNPQLHACSSRGGSIIAVDRSIAVLDSTGQSLQMHIGFDTNVDVVGMCQENQFLVVGERSGNFHLIHIPSKQTLLTKILVEKSLSEKTYLNLFIEKDNADAGIYHMFILTNNGFFCIMCVPLAETQEAIDKMDIFTGKQLQGQIKTAFISTEEYHSLGCQDFVLTHLVNKIHLIIVGKGDYVLSKWQVDTTNNLVSVRSLADSSLIKDAVKLQVLGNLLFVLDTENILSMWDVYSLTLICDWPLVHTEEFLLSTESDSSPVLWQGLANVKLIVMTVPNNKQMRSLMVFALPTMQVLYSLEVSIVSSLVQSGIDTDTIYFLEGIHAKHEISSEGPVSIVVMRSLTEALPENRLSRLLHKHKFTEAESFAIQFGLDVELVYKVKANTIIEKLASASVGTYSREVWLDLVNEAKENLQKIQDSRFVVDYCINAPWPLYEATQEMLNYAKVRILKKDDRSIAPSCDEAPVSITEVLRAQARLTTFYGAFGSEKFSGIAWTEFLNNKDIFKNILFQLEEGNLSCAQYLWLRHQADFESSFDEKMLENLLNAIHFTVPLKELHLWLKNVVVPFLRRVVPQGQKILAKWLEQGARNLELTDKANWPENGLQMAELFFTSKNQGEMGLTTFGQWTPLRCDCEEVHRLKKLVNDLQELINLYRKYNCRLALCDFEKENATTIVFRMVDKILAPELVPSILEKFIKPYLCEHNLQKDELLLQYIKNLLERCFTRSTSVFETAWEAKAIAVIGCISDTNLKFDAVLQLMHSAMVPWSAAVEQLVKQHLEMNHVKVKLLQESYRLMEMKKLLRGYGIRDTNLLKDKKMIMRLVKYILKQDTPTSLEDALKIVAAYMLPTVEVYILRMIDLIDKERGEESLTLLKSLAPAEAEKVAERLSMWGTLVLQNKADNPEEHKMQMLMTKTLVEILKFLFSLQRNNPLKKDECEANLKMFETLATLQEDFDIFLSVEEFRNPSMMSRLLENHIKAYVTVRSLSKSRKVQTINYNSEDGKTKNRCTESRLHRLALLLQRSEQELGEKLVLRALDAGKVEDAVKICREFYENHANEETGKLLFSACQRLCHMLGADVPMIAPNDMNLPAVIYEMACQAATVCSPDLLLDCLELCKYTLVAKDAYTQCQIENYGFTAKTTSFGGDKDPYEEWTYDDFFNEDGIVLDPQIALPVAYETISSLLPVCENKLYPLDSTSLANGAFIKGQNRLLPARTPICAVLQNLMECSQCELALRVVLCSFGSCLQHGISNNMDFSLSEKLHDGNTIAETKSFLVAMKQKCTSVILTTILTLLHKVFNCRDIDQNLALGYCTVLPKEDMFNKLWDVIDNTWQNYRKVLAVALIGAQLANQCGEAEEKKKFQELVTDAEWGIQLGKFGISFETVFRQPAIRKKELIRTLVQNPKVDTDLILNYCSTFMLDSDAALQLCIETLLLQNANTNHVEDDSAEYSKKQPHSTLLARALEIIPLLKSTKDLVTSLSGILYKLDPYDYETIEIVLKAMQNADEKNTSIRLNQALSLLKHLESYKRISPPVDVEHQYVLERVIPLSPAAQTRLPFHLIFFRTAQCFWNIISAELSEESFPTLLLISKLMKVSLDTLHMSAARHVFEKKLKPKIFEMRNAGYTSVVNKETTKTVQTIQSYLLSIINPEWAAAIAHKIAQEFPIGPDYVQALKFCLSLTEKWLKNTTVKDDSREKAEVLQKKLYIQYKLSATENVLIKHNLNTGEHLKAIGKPANLIISLYEHHSIDQRIQNPTGRDYPDIHMAAKEIAEINDLDMNKIWDKLLDKWLCQSILPSEKNQEIFGDVGEDEELRRVIYLLQSCPMDYSSRMLFVVTTSTTSPIGVTQLTFAHRSRALKCLLYLADTNTVESLFKKPIENVKYLLKCFIYLAEFEILNIPYTYESFHRNPKEGMIKGLWKNHSHEPTAVRLVTELSLEYKVYDSQLWNGLLQKLLGFNMIQYLRRVLIAITGIHSLWEIPNFSRAWRSVILSPSLTASCPPSPKQLEECCQCFVILLRCPVLADLDVIGIAKQYAQLDLPAFTLGCLMLIPESEKREQQIQGFLSTCNTEAVLQQIDEHMNTGEVVVFASQIRSLVLDSIIKEKLYEKFLKTKYFPLLKQQLMNTHRIKELVDYFAKKDCIDDATALIQEYQEKCGNPTLADIPSSDLLQMYLNGSEEMGVLELP
ncbi:kinetochore-associated protein 1 [Falco cherrug]|uniref:kinetochore-associated protein 1 n=1 Tax=Falco cherrug TaxID=345164 RepID=UPI00247ACC91|nr:kinetochore-associated protein 1 [Falco cherrug]XP_055565616.1 kinetochore-associated protein 1 [Falco cherrug]XP_055565620.1 kinetochore-associated protein 1 [Falco cherrug]XP_055565626.1 kinetochore-associated protein 1 [Falco cherrug]